MMLRFTKKERDAIHDAYLQVSHLMDSSDLQGRFDDLIAQDRREQTKSLHSSRVLLCRFWFKGFDKPDAPLMSVAYVTPTACQAAMYGVRMSEAYAPGNRTGWVRKARVALAGAEMAHRAAMGRMLAKVEL